MTKRNVPFKTLAQSIAKTLNVGDLTAKEIELLSYGVATLFGYEVTSVGERVANEIHALLPKDQLSRRQGRERTLKEMLDRRSTLSSVLSHVIFTAGLDSGTERSADIGIVFCWIAFGIEKAPLFAAKLKHL
jgi:hypothetical protein